MKCLRPSVIRRKSWAACVHIGEHICALYDGAEELGNVSSNFVQSAIAGGAKVYLIADSPAVAAELHVQHPRHQSIYESDLRAALKKHKIDVETLEKNGQLEILDDSKTYLKDGCFDPERMKSEVKVVVAKALAAGWHNVYILASMAWARTSANGVQHLHSYEREVNILIKECPHFVGLCMYDRGIFSPGDLCKVLQSHPQAAINGEFFARNFYFNSPDERYDADPKRRRLENWLANLRERKNLDTELEDRTIELHLKNLELQRELNMKAKLEHEKRLAELASEQKSVFVSTLSHEIRTPLHGIMTASMLLNSMDLGAEAHEYTKLVQLSSMHLQSVVNDVLSMSLLETGKVTVETEHFNLREAVQATMKMVSLPDAALGKRFIAKLNDLPTEEVEGDRKKLTQVLLNLLSNSSKFTSEDGVITVSARVLQPPEPIGLAQFCVTDNGIGIPPEKLADVCRPFYQVDQGNTRRFSGLGLGLSVCKSLIEVLKGCFSIHSDGLGRGTVCTFTFPFCKHADAVDRKTPSLSQPPQISPSLNVLLVEDNRLNAAITLRLLNRLGVKRATTVEDGMSAVEATREGSFDLVLMDLHMPGKLDGFEAARLIKIIMSTRRRRARVVALTANVSTDVRQRCEKEMDGYIAKPLSLAQLVDVLRSVDVYTATTNHSAAS